MRKEPDTSEGIPSTKKNSNGKKAVVPSRKIHEREEMEREILGKVPENPRTGIQQNFSEAFVYSRTSTNGKQ